MPSNTRAGELNGKVAWITGGGSGIGLAAAIELNKAGAKVVISGRSEKTLKEALKQVKAEALVCDVGRDQIPAHILNKRGPLTDSEWVEVRRQPELGAALLSDASFDDIREWILCHRERPDGTGYPRGLVAEEIPLEARILSVTDAYVAMTSDRPHRCARQHDDACQELRRCAGTQFDVAVVQAFLRAAERRDSRLSRAAA